MRERERLAKNDSNDFCYQVFLLASPFVLFLLGAHILQFCRRCFSFWAVKSMLHNLSTGTVDCDCQRIVFNALKLKLDSNLAPAHKSMQASIWTWLRLWPKNWHISASNRACERCLMPTGIKNLCSAFVGEGGETFALPPTNWSVRVMPRVSSNCRRWDVNVTKSQLWPTYARHLGCPPTLCSTLSVCLCLLLVVSVW